MLENAEAAILSDQRIEVDIIFKRLTILVVDDDNNHLSLIRYLLCKYGINVMLADNASLAFELIQQNTVDLLISDIVMPGKDGYWLIQQVRLLPLSPIREIPATYLMEEVAKLL